jgi:hypothetical protein
MLFNKVQLKRKKKKIKKVNYFVAELMHHPNNSSVAKEGVKRFMASSVELQFVRLLKIDKIGYSPS